MKIRTKMVIAFLSVVLTPILLLVGSASLMMHFQARTIREIYGIENTSDLLSSNMLEVFTEVTSHVQEEILAESAENKDALDQRKNWEHWNEELHASSAYLVVTRKDQVCFDGQEMYPAAEKERMVEPAVTELSNDRLSEEFYELLPTTMGAVAGNQFFYLGSPWQCLVSSVTYTASNGEDGVIYLITPVRDIFPSFRILLKDVGMMVALVLIVTALLLTMWLYSAILRPLQTLQKATRSIRDGNLDFSLEVTGKDEISELCQDFEEMRRRLKETAEEKIQYDRENKVLISNISHDLKTPLTAVKGYCEGILDGVASTPERLEKYVRTIYNKTLDMQKLIDELTLYSKIDSNRIPYNFTKIRVKDYFADCAEEMTMDLEARDIEMTYSNFLEDDVTIIGDAEQLKRVMNNIVSNSVKYMDKKKKFISLRLRDDGDFIRVEVEDNGRGIAVRDLPYIFDRFYRTDASRNSATGGSGIGLSIVKKIVEDHGGRIWATSKEGIGTIMHVVLRKYQEVPYEQNTDRRR